jgi:hypothetical protein
LIPLPQDLHEKRPTKSWALDLLMNITLWYCGHHAIKLRKIKNRSPFLQLDPRRVGGRDTKSNRSLRLTEPDPAIPFSTAVI